MDAHLFLRSKVINVSYTNCGNATSLHNAEGLELAAALTAVIAEQAGIPCLFLKGPAASKVEMRPERPSADIDVLVHPLYVDSLVNELFKRGWKLRPFPDGVGIPKHSHTAYHPNWPIDIDIHFRFPGLDAEPAAVFNKLYEEASVHYFGGMKAKVPSLAGMLIIQITHALRYWDQDGRFFGAAQSDYNFLMQKALPISWETLVQALDDTGSWAAMKPFLLQKYPEQTRSIVFPDPSIDWSSRTIDTFEGKLRAVAFLNAPFSEKPRILLRSVFPTREDLAAGHLPLLEANFWVVMKYRFLRLKNFIFRIPFVLSKITRNLRKNGSDPN